jgi:small subunit ribosomal protein S31
MIVIEYIGLESEESVPFHEHIFLDHWMKDIPRRSAIGQFLEVMCLALSKNPYITVERKKETFDWFLKYFKEHEDILLRTGAISTPEIESGSTLTQQSLSPESSSQPSQ